MKPVGQTPVRLSPTQTRIVEMAVREFGDKQIADALDMSFSAVRRHWERMFKKLNCHTRGKAMWLAKAMQSEARPVGNPATLAKMPTRHSRPDARK